MKYVFVDTNILLEILLSRRLSKECEAIVSNPANEYAISVITVHIIWYMAEKYKIRTELIDDLLSVWVILPVTDQTIKAARNRYDGKDFEDCLQATCAESADYEEIITIDKYFKQYSHTDLPVTVLK